jgi:hypothetical protein
MDPETLELLDATDALFAEREDSISLVRLLELFEHFERPGELSWEQQHVSDIATVVIARSITRKPARA